MILRLLLTLLFFLPLGGCKDSADDFGYLPMPEEFIRYWNGHGRTVASANLNIKADGTINIRQKRNNMFYELKKYKIIHIEDSPDEIIFYALINSRYAAEFLMYRDPEATPEEKAKWLDPNYGWYLSYEKYTIKRRGYNDSDMLFTSYLYCDLPEQDWDLPAKIHWQKIQSGTCEKRPGVRQFWSFDSYTPYSDD